MSISYEQVFESVNLAVTSLTYRWKTYCELFDSGAENLAVLNESGASVFALFQRLLLDDTILALSRLTDPSLSGKEKKNASFRHLLKYADTKVDPKIITEACDILNSLDKRVANARIHRMKALAHSDLRHAVKDEVLPSIKYDDLEESMQMCRDIILKMGTSKMYCVSHNTIVPFGKGPSELLSRLQNARGYSGNAD